MEAFNNVRTQGTDIWSVGVILYRMVAARLPFSASDIPSLIQAITTTDAPPLPDTVPQPLAQIIFKALARDPSMRYQSAKEMRAALETVANKIAGAANFIKIGDDYFKKKDWRRSITSAPKARTFGRWV